MILVYGIIDMKKYRLTPIKEKLDDPLWQGNKNIPEFIEVEANSEEEAREKAKKIWEQMPIISN